MLAWPRVASTVFCSISLIGAGRAPALSELIKTLASSTVKSPEITALPSVMACCTVGAVNSCWFKKRHLGRFGSLLNLFGFVFPKIQLSGFANLVNGLLRVFVARDIYRNPIVIVLFEQINLRLGDSKKINPFFNYVARGFNRAFNILVFKTRGVYQKHQVASALQI